MASKSLTSVFATDQAMAAELNKERASALGRTGRKLEELLERCASLREALSQAQGERRAALLGEYAEARKLALTWTWYMVVQREAIGLRRHDDVDVIYPAPPRIAE